MSTDANFEELLQNFKEITGVGDANVCLHYLVSHKWDLSSAVIDAMEKLPDCSEEDVSETVSSNTEDVQTTMIRIRCGDHSLQKKFFLDDNLETLFRYCEENGFINCTYQLILKLPNELEYLDKDKTFRQLNFSHQEEIKAFKSQNEKVIACKNQPENNQVGEDESDEEFENIVDVLSEIDVFVPEALPNKRNRATIWYKRVNETFDWKIVSSYAAKLEEAYMEFMSGGQERIVKLYFDDYKDYVFVDFTKMIITSVKSKEIVLYHLRRKDMLADIPVSWNWDGTSLAEYHLIELPIDSSEYCHVEKSVRNTSTGVIIEKIERVENPIRYKQYLLLKQKLQVQHLGKRDIVIERQLFHGTDEPNVPSICSNGFNRSLCGQHGTVWGNGCYFAKRFSYSSNFGKRKIFFANVLTGKFTTGDPSMKVAPDYDKDRGIKYDSVVNNVSGPSIFVVFSDNHAYPSYLVTYVSKKNKK